MNLLNNDYYLDLKTEAINRYIEQVVDSHIANQDIHFTWDSIKGYVQDVADVRGLTKDTLVILPIYNFDNDDIVELKNIAEIQSRIRSVPHNLNGYTLIFQFNQAIESDKEVIDSPSATRNLNLGDEVLNFSNFYNGRIKIVYDNTKYVNVKLHPDLSFYETDSYFDKALTNSNKYTAYPANAPVIRGSGCNGRGAVISLNNMVVNGEMKGLCISNILQKETISGYSSMGEFLDSFGKVDEDKVLAELHLNGNLNIENINIERIGGLSNGTKFIDISGSILDPVNVNVDKHSAENVSGNYFYNDSQYTFNRKCLNLNDGKSNLMGIQIDPGIIQKIIYNVDGQTPYSTMILWAKQDAEKGKSTSMLTNPLFSDYPELSIGKDNYGFAFGPGGIYFPDAPDEDIKTGDNVPGINAYESGFNYFKYNLLNKWVMYVFEFQHRDWDDADREPYVNFKKFGDSIPVGEKKMRINITAVTSANRPINDTPDLSNPQHYILSYNPVSKVNADCLLTNPSSTTNVFNPFSIGFANVPNNNPTYLWNGSICNLLLFNTFLSKGQLNSLYKSYLSNGYLWAYNGEQEDINKLKESLRFSALDIDSVNRFKISHCRTEQLATQLT